MRGVQVTYERHTGDKSGVQVMYERCTGDV